MPTDIMRFYNLLEADTQLVRKKDNNGKKKKTFIIKNNIFQPPKAAKPIIPHYDEDQTKILVNNLEKLTIKGIKYRIAILLDIFTGTRLGKLVRLEWSDIDFKNGIINIKKSSQYLAPKGVFTKSPKAETSIRYVAIPDFIVSLLKNISYGMKNQNQL